MPQNDKARTKAQELADKIEDMVEGVPFGDVAIAFALVMFRFGYGEASSHVVVVGVPEGTDIKELLDDEGTEPIDKTKVN